MSFGTDRHSLRKSPKIASVGDGQNQLLSRFMEEKMTDLKNFKGTVMELLGIEYREVTKEKIVLTMPVTPKTYHPWGSLHGGVSVVLAETAATMGAVMNIDQEKQVAVGLEINASHIRPKREGMLTATATPIHIGHAVSVWNIRIVDEKGNMICTSRCTLAIVDKK
jgi:1,4-dihydroxy-2-naphthoyl-CoA hydrolase